MLWSILLSFLISYLEADYLDNLNYLQCHLGFNSDLSTQKVCKIKLKYFYLESYLDIPPPIFCLWSSQVLPVLFSISFFLTCAAALGWIRDTDEGFCTQNPSINQEKFHFIWEFMAIPLYLGIYSNSILCGRHLQPNPSRAQQELGEFCHTAQNKNKVN